MMNLRSVSLLYNILLPTGMLLTAPAYLAKMFRRGNYGRDFFQRFGFYSDSARAKLGGAPTRPVWVQAVSVGEVLVALKFIQALRRAHPAQPVVLSCTTSTAHELALARCHDLCEVLYHPLDLPWAVASAFNLLQPKLLVLVEAEIWPNLLSQARHRGVPVVLINARLSPRSERRYQSFAPLTRPLFEELAQVQVQTPDDAARWSRLGIPPERISCPGSIKYDQSAQPVPEAMITSFRNLLNALRGNAPGPVILAGSTHPGEERLIAEAFLKVREQNPQAFFVVVPRHFERAETVRRDLNACGLEPVLKTELADDASNPPPTSVGRCLIVNTTGELWAWYHLADLVLIGKSFLSDEGQNPIEPILAGKPVIAGPILKNFASLAERLTAAGGWVQVAHNSELPEAMTLLLETPERAAAIVTAGRSVVAQDQGAAARTVTGLAPLLAGT
jgi:3-deoxy-D-manno-octulosonic-acid transferase